MNRESQPQFSYNLFEQGSDKLLAVCDDNILGKTFGGGGLEIIVSDFYRGKKCVAQEVLKIAKKSTIINAVGNKIIDLLIKNNMVEKHSVLKIGSVSHAQVISVK